MTILSLYGIFTLTYLIIRLIASIRYSPSLLPPASGSIAVVIPVFNEDPVAFERCLRSVLSQSLKPDVVYVIDDGSFLPITYNIACSYIGSDRSTKVVVERFPVNRGKRAAQAWAFKQALELDFICTVDSDTILDVDAIYEALRPFSQGPEVLGVTGNVKVTNPRVNLLTRLTDLRYSVAFGYERAAHSFMDSVICACGSFSIFRTSVIQEHLDDYVSQKFLGVQVEYGDDRRLTNYCLLTGKVVYQSTAVASTLVPSKLIHYLRQQNRWNKSFVRETLWSLSHLSFKKPRSWIIILDILFWIFFTVILISTFLVKPIILGYGISAYYIIMLIALSWLRSVRHSVDSRYSFLYLSPIYALMYLSILMPLKFYSVLTLREGSWGTRQSGIEVTES